MTIAEKLREIHAGPGSIIEIASRSDGIDKAIGESIGEDVQAMQGWLLEVTAVGEGSILAFILVGSKSEGRTNYGDVDWIREHPTESMFRQCSIMNKVGQKTTNGIEWVDADMECIYARLKAA